MAYGVHRKLTVVTILMTADEKKALVVLSGGQDSTTCLYWAIREFGASNVVSLTFDYGQRHRIELDCAQRVAEAAGVRNTILPIDTFSAIGGDALTDQEIDVDTDDSALPNTFVPARNVIFLSYAAAVAYREGIGTLVTGVAESDYSGYPDCRHETIASLKKTLSLALDRPIQILTPLMNLSKKETVMLAQSLGALPTMAFTHSCYNGERPPCGKCPACQLRAKGFAEAGISDPLLAIV